MVVWDTNVLALYFGKKLSPDDQLRMDGLVAEMKRKREPIGIPAQVLAEYLVGVPVAERQQALSIFASTSFRFLPYDQKSALETIMLGQQAIKRKASGRPRQAVKVDCQIIAIAKSNRCRLLLTNDHDMIIEAIGYGLHATSIASLDIPDSLKQHKLELPDQEVDSAPEHASALLSAPDSPVNERAQYQGDPRQPGGEEPA